MSNALTVKEANLSAVESALVSNDLSKLSNDQRLSYYKNLCESVGLNYLTNPFMYITLQGKLSLYARKDATEQLRKLHGVSIQVISKEQKGDFYEVSVRAKDKTGKEDEELAVIFNKGLAGEAMANSMMKCLTKAKRRVTLSICGLGMVDESELETIPQDQRGFASQPQLQNPFKDETPFEELETQESKLVSDLKLGDFVCTIGKKYVGQKLSDFDAFQLDGFVKWMHKNAADKNQPMTGDWLEFAQKAEAYLCSIETPVSP